MHVHSQFRITSQPEIHGFGLWEEAGVSGENAHTQRQWKNMETPHRKPPAKIIIRKLLVVRQYC